MKVGDRVVVLNYGPTWQGDGIIVSINKYVGIIHIVVRGREGGFYKDDFVLKEVYDSPLYKALL